jgi:hypothetical protein
LNPRENLWALTESSKGQSLREEIQIVKSVDSMTAISKKREGFRGRLERGSLLVQLMLWIKQIIFRSISADWHQFKTVLLDFSLVATK